VNEELLHIESRVYRGEFDTPKNFGTREKLPRFARQK
jgi:hypothetical protein